jgi:hypothetical protein
MALSSCIFHGKGDSVVPAALPITNDKKDLRLMFIISTS